MTEKKKRKKTVHRLTINITIKYWLDWGNFIKMLLQVSSWRAGFLLQIPCGPTLRPGPVVSSCHLSWMLYSLPWHHTTLPDSSLPPDWHAEEHTRTLLTLTKTHPGRGYRYKRARLSFYLAQRACCETVFVLSPCYGDPFYL